MHVNQSIDLHVLTEIDYQKSKWLGSYISYTIALRHFLYILFSSTFYPMGAIDFYSSDWISKHMWWFHCQILSADELIVWFSLIFVLGKKYYLRWRPLSLWFSELYWKYLSHEPNQVWTNSNLKLHLLLNLTSISL